MNLIEVVFALHGKKSKESDIMNLIEVVFALHGKKSEERRHLLIEWDVNPALWLSIQVCFTDEGQFSQVSKDSFIQFLAKLLVEKP